MVPRGQIAAADDIFFQRPDEARERLADGTGAHDVVVRRKGKHAWALAHPGRASYGRKPGPALPLHGLPDEVRHADEAFLWYFDRILALDVRRDSSDSTLTGIAASPGRYTGTVRIIRCEADFDRLRAGGVLVCPATSSVWSVLFPTVGALVTDFGGMLSHPAIIAREFGVPQSLRPAWPRHSCRTAKWSPRTERPELWRSLDECAAGRSRANQSEQASAADQCRE